MFSQFNGGRDAVAGVARAGTDAKDVITVTQAGGAISIAGLDAQVTVSHADEFDIITISGLAGDRRTWLAPAANADRRIVSISRVLTFCTSPGTIW